MGVHLRSIKARRLRLAKVTARLSIDSRARRRCHRVRRWTWKHALAVRVLVFLGWPSWKAYRFVRLRLR